MMKQKWCVAPVLAIAALAGTLMPARTHAGGLTNARAGIQATIDRTNALLKRNGSAKEIADAMYEDDLMITGEGEKGSYRDLKSFMGPLAEYVADGSRCRLEVVDPIRSSGGLAVAFVAEHCAATKSGEKDEDARILYVFRKGQKGWRVTMESFSWGLF